MINADNALKCLLQLLQCGIIGKKTILPSDSDWSSVISESSFHAVQAIAYDAMLPCEMPKELYDNWRRTYYQTVSSYVCCKTAHQQLTELLDNNNIPFATFKGFASSLYYPKPELRAMGDVDFYVPKEFFNKCHKLLIANGYELESKDRDHDWSYVKSNTHFELHFKFPGVPDGHEGKTAKKYFDSLIADSHMEHGVRISSDFHHGLIMLLHMASHIMGEGIGLRHLCDWAVFVNFFSDNEFVEMFNKPFSEIGIWKFAQILTLVCEKYLLLPHKKWTETIIDEEVIDYLAYEIFTKGNFGSKVGNDLSGLMVAEGFSGKVSDKSPVMQMIDNLVFITKQHWPVSKKVSAIVPFGCIWFALKYSVFAMFGKRQKINLLSMAKIAKNRKELYKKFKLFVVSNEEK